MLQKDEEIARLQLPLPRVVRCIESLASRVRQDGRPAGGQSS